MTVNDTSSRIHLLDQATVNRIAAGEVIERPASVVKELVENAIDADARSVRIELTTDRQGICGIRVSDDGTGMSPDEAPLAFTPHATSKIAGIEDLHTIHSLGFRGEALASIAAVSKVTLVTRHRGAGTGTRMAIEGGEIRERGETGSPEGTSILVEDLFYNTPARKKFQKGKNTEIAAIHAVIEGICLAHPGISFRLLTDQREQLLTDRSTSMLDTVARIYGSDVAARLIPVRKKLPFMTVSGFVSPPDLSRKDTARMHISVNKRFVSSPPVIAAVKEGYGTLLPRDRFPVAFIDLTIDTHLVDVNVHPAKKQVRLSNEKEITSAVSEAIRSTLLGRNLIPSANAPHPYGGYARPRVDAPGIPVVYEFPDPGPAGVSEPTHTGTISTDRQLRQTELDSGTRADSGHVPAMEVIGQFGGIYIIAANRFGELFLVDQHAAHERVMYEMVSRETGTGRLSQELLVPVVFQRTAKESAILRELMPALADGGFEIEEFGRDSFIVRAIPVFLGKIEDMGLIDEMIGDLVGEERIREPDARERVIRVIACRGAVKAGTVCSAEQSQRLLNQLRQTENPFTCPHGRPTMIRFTRDELDRMFRRI